MYLKKSLNLTEFSLEVTTSSCFLYLITLQVLLWNFGCL